MEKRIREVRSSDAAAIGRIYAPYVSERATSFESVPPDEIEITRRIEEELRSQYIVAYRSDSAKAPGEYRAVSVAIRKPGVNARTIRGYIP